MIEKLKQIEVKFHQIEEKLADPEIIADMDRYADLSKEYKDLKEDAAVLVEGKLSVREDEDIKLIVDRVLPLAELRGIPKGPPRPPEVLAKEAPVKVYLRLKREQMPACEQVLRRMQGDIPVYINLPDEDMTLLAPRDWWCDDADDARANLLEYVLRDDIKVVKKQ